MTAAQSVSSGDSSRGMRTVSRESSSHVRCWTRLVAGSAMPRSASARFTSPSIWSRRPRTRVSNFPGVWIRPKNVGASFCTLAWAASTASCLAWTCTPAMTSAKWCSGPSFGAVITARTNSRMSFWVDSSLCTISGARRTPSASTSDSSDSSTRAARTTRSSIG